MLREKSALTHTGYLYRAFALEPNDPLLCLLGCVASLGRATNRQVDNRNHTIVQGLSMLKSYARLRGENEPEVEYNFGRAYHQMGALNFSRRADSRPVAPCGAALPPRT